MKVGPRKNQARHANYVSPNAPERRGERKPPKPKTHHHAPPSDPVLARELAAEDSYARLANYSRDMREPSDVSHRPAHEVYEVARARVTGEIVNLADVPSEEPDNDDVDPQAWASAFIDGNYGFRSKD